MPETLSDQAVLQISDTSLCLFTDTRSRLGHLHWKKLKQFKVPILSCWFLNDRYIPLLT